LATSVPIRNSQSVCTSQHFLLMYSEISDRVVQSKLHTIYPILITAFHNKRTSVKMNRQRNNFHASGNELNLPPLIELNPDFHTKIDSEGTIKTMTIMDMATLLTPTIHISCRI